MSIRQSGHGGKRHQLRRRGKATIMPNQRISDLSELKNLLQTAIEVEHSTIPPYLCAMYSIRDGYNVEAVQIIRSVVLEEMLHMVLAANVLNAIGGKPSLNHRKFIPMYPRVPFFHFNVNLEGFSPHSIETFLKIERPEPPEGTDSTDLTIAQYYEVIEHGLKDISGKETIFTGDMSRQITPEYYYGGGGEAIPVTDLDSALRALNEIIGQGEGLHHTIWDGDEQLGEVEEPAHFFRFNEIHKGQRYTSNDTINSGPSGQKLIVQWDQVYPMRLNPRMSHYPKDSELWSKAYEFNRTYMGLLNELHAALNGEPQRLMQSVVRMYDLKYQAVELMKIPVGNGEMTAGPSFEFVE